jgi:aryl-alcohol dehydrogenase-like predicted oxidoreductase
VGLAEMAIREEVGLLAYSPLSFGALSGKYLNGQNPKGARLTLFPEFSRYLSPPGVAATKAYVDIANQAGLDPAQMALAYVNTRRFVTSNIIGATTMDQLAANIASVEVSLSTDVVNAIEAAHEIHTYPSP